MPRRRNGISDYRPSADINISSLVDVAFTLLVIFIITAPIMQGGVDVRVPRAQAETISNPDGVIVSVTAEGDLFIGDVEVAMDDFETALTDVVREAQASAIYLRADEGVAYGRVLQVLGSMKALDIANVGLVAEPEPARGAGRRR
jgi:biopolymer transport protein ExbD/biopolymer transport protein TolR